MPAGTPRQRADNRPLALDYGLHTPIVGGAWAAAALPKPRGSDQLEQDALNNYRWCWIHPRVQVNQKGKGHSGQKGGCGPVGEGRY